ncbi:Zinc finger, CCCH-type [Penicillium griseofulvum]|uniref:Zinc finger, CCCH-type n=1 Tax=Penicillium patulum TaxID=5078 RepID=A0A135LGP8_PENPA|nr:Zinc finger, CCCH-type [Penicillium griseofulvum]KXG48161.1 Zinc finger, CCCH-type [Penicillium griseofulvum]
MERSFDNNAGPTPQIQAGGFCPNQLYEIYLIIWTLYGVRAFVFSAPLLHVHAPHVASATKPINSHVISSDLDGGQGSPEVPSSLISDELSAARSHGVASTEPGAARQSSTRRQKCRFFESKKGCRLGASCPYLHDASAVEAKQPVSEQQTLAKSSGDESQSSAQAIVTGAERLNIGENQSKQRSAAAPVQPQRPVSKLEQSDPREFQINQLRRRYRPQEVNDAQGCTLTFGLVPSDPDFPFELERLQCVLHVPSSYPKGRPTLAVTNSEMEAAYQANIARGFDEIVDFSYRSNGRGTLLGWLNSLDKKLESLLTTLERGPTLKFFANLGDGSTTKEPTKAPEKAPSQPSLSRGRDETPSATAKPAPKARTIAPRYTAEAKAAAEKRRATETKQLEARLGRLPMYQKLQDGRTYVIPIQPTKKDRLPRTLQALKTVKLIVPQLYPLEHSSIKLQGVEGPEVKATEVGFTQWVEQTSQLSLVSQVNYLASNIHKFAETPLPKEEETTEAVPPTVEEEEEEEDDVDVEEPTKAPAQDNEDRPHLVVIPRPPEWSVPNPENGVEGTSDESSYEEDEYSDEEDEEGGAPVPASVDNNATGRGVALSFPFLELYGIELLEILNLNITVKCERCKVSVDIKHVPQITDEKGQMPKMESCRKCANNMSVAFRKQLMHSHANRAGYLDMGGCTIGDMLLSDFIPTCSECSTPHPAPGIPAVRGESAMGICRQCHRKMVFKIPEVKFLLSLLEEAFPRKESPKKSSALSQDKNFRDAVVASTTPKVNAGLDSAAAQKSSLVTNVTMRKQITRTNTQIAGSGFWEGGKGTRNRTLMSRKDPRKFKRMGANAPASSSSKRK